MCSGSPAGIAFYENGSYKTAPTIYPFWGIVLLQIRFLLEGFEILRVIQLSDTPDDLEFG
jgi:hypothetical protein